MTGLSLITDALTEIGVQAQGEPVSAENAAFALGRLNSIIDSWNGERSQVLADVGQTFALVPGLSPHTIGTAPAAPATQPTFSVTSRPVNLLSASLVDVDGNRTPLDIHHGIDWWAGQESTETTGQPSDLCYVPAWPFGLCYFWPVPSAVQNVELFSRVVLAAFDLSTTITLAPGYQSALTYTLAENLATPMAQPMPADLPRKAAKARALIQRNNALTPRIATVDSGMPLNGVGLPGNIYSGRVR